MTEPDLRISESELYELYSMLADATQAAANGDPNECASKAADAKDKVVAIRENGEDITGDR
jgi:hypothetical protein